MTNRPWLNHYDAGVPATLEPYPHRTLIEPPKTTVGKVLRRELRRRELEATANSAP